jgi:hypothetical protein
MRFDFTYFLLRVLRYYFYYCIFPGFSRIQPKQLKYVVNRGILGKLEVALGQQKSAQVCIKASNYLVLRKIGLQDDNMKPVKPKLLYIIFINPVRTSKRTQHFTITNIISLTLFTI